MKDVKKIAKTNKKNNNLKKITECNISFIALLIYIVVIGLFQFVIPTTEYDYSVKLIVGLVVVCTFIYDIVKKKINIKFEKKSPIFIGLLVFSVYSVISFFINYNSTVESFTSLYLLFNLFLGYVVINNKYSKLEKLCIRKTIIFTTIIVGADILLKTFVYTNMIIHDSNLYLGNLDIVGKIFATSILLLLVVNYCFKAYKERKLLITSISGSLLLIIYLIYTIMNNTYLFENVYLTPLIIVTAFLSNIVNNYKQKK